VGTRSSTTTDKAFQHLKAPPMITKSLKWWSKLLKLLVRFFNVLPKTAKPMLCSG